MKLKAIPRWIFLIALCSTATFSHGQSSKLISAASYLDNGQYEKAFYALEEARVNEKTMSSERTYYQLLRLYTALALDSTGQFASLSANPLMDGLNAAKKTFEYDEAKKMDNLVVIEADKLARLMYNAGLIAYRATSYKEAFDYFNAAYETHGVIYDYGKVKGRDTATYYFASVCADMAGEKAIAETYYKNLIAMGYNEPGVYANLGKMYMAQEQFAKAEQIFSEGRAKYPDSQDLLIDELNYYLQQGRAPEAIDKFKLAVANDPNNPELYFAMGTAYQALIQLDSVNAIQHMAEARAAYAKTIELNPKSFDANLNTGALYYNEGVLLQDMLNKVDLRDQAKANKLEA